MNRAARLILLGGKRNLLANGDFSVGGPPPAIAGNGWSIASGIATGIVDDSSAQLQWLALPLTPGVTYRYRLNILTRVAGSLVLRLSGGAGANVSTASISSAGIVTGTLVCVDHRNFEISKTATFVGTIDDVELRRV